MNREITITMYIHIRSKWQALDERIGPEVYRLTGAG
jgi:hypothetical protein